MFGVILTYIFSVYGFLYLWTEYTYNYNDGDDDPAFNSNATGCGNLFSCFIETVRRGF
jgi:hypothetical protein